MLKHAFMVDSNSDLPLYQQVYDHLAQQIRTGQLAAGERLPGKRSLAEDLGVSVNTVDTAYQMLTAEGYLESRLRSGFFVQPFTDLLPETACLPSPAPQCAQSAVPPSRFDLSVTGVDTSLFPFRTWGRIQKDLLYSAPELLAHGHRQGDEDLRQAIAEYLRAYRGVQCSAHQIVVGAGMEYLLGLLARMLGGDGQAMAAVENPGYRRSWVILRNNGVPCQFVDINSGGMDLAALSGSGANIAYVTPSHQFPTGVTMPVGRRAELLRWAQEKPGRYIIEDDYDSEFRFDIRPLPSLQGMAGPAGPVIYLTTFSKSLSPSIRIACMVLPQPLMERYLSMYGDYSNTVSRFDQQTLCQFIQGGHFTRHLARMRKVYRGRMEALADALENAFGPGRVILQGRHTGLHLLLTLNNGPGEAVMVRCAQEQGVLLTGLSSYFMARRQNCPPNTVVIGFASLPPQDIEPLAKALKKAWDPAS